MRCSSGKPVGMIEFLSKTCEKIALFMLKPNPPKGKVGLDFKKECR